MPEHYLEFTNIEKKYKINSERAKICFTLLSALIDEDNKENNLKEMTKHGRDLIIISHLTNKNFHYSKDLVSGSIQMFTYLHFSIGFAECLRVLLMV